MSKPLASTDLPLTAFPLASSDPLAKRRKTETSHMSGYNTMKKEFIGHMRDKIANVHLSDPALHFDMRLAVPDSPGMQRFYRNDVLVQKEKIELQKASEPSKAVASSAIVCCPRLRGNT